MNRARTLYDRWKAAGKPRVSVDWDSVDWSLSNIQLAEKYGTYPQLFSDRRRRLASGTLYKRITFSGANWSLDNVTLGRQFGCTPQYVSQYALRNEKRARRHRGGRRGPRQNPVSFREEM